ncbi:hypothetical protein GCM10008995_19510 [Halobellus salinus]|uniref:Uncharacterized protein n=1 Tax=Halobellus salinus TaxID=931585 RepID=A0A830EU08_9EURY|nr:hypothetical protein [Halobellus salinus]GGJ09718.1 hypothetical protein GCM10008995_19510 [Halobellus salinus]SMP24972.1 hypothetical protein SAMN06265347_11089 [Halobellus salinus]
MRRGGVNGAVPGTTVGVATALDELKSRGSAVLVVGTVPASAYTRLSARLLGEGPDRRRLVVEHRPSPDQRFDHVTRWTPEWTRVFRYRIASRRSTAAADAPETEGESWTSEAPDTDSGATADSTDNEGYAAVAESVNGSVADLGAAVGGAIEWFDDVVGGLDPAELRVAFDCVVPLLSAYPKRTVFRLFHLLTYQIRSVGGMGHVRVSRPLDAESVRLLAPLFDAIIELRLDGTEAVDRWHFRDADVTSEWLPVAASW